MNTITIDSKVFTLKYLNDAGISDSFMLRYKVFHEEKSWEEKKENTVDGIDGETFPFEYDEYDNLEGVDENNQIVKWPYNIGVYNDSNNMVACMRLCHKKLPCVKYVDKLTNKEIKDQFGRNIDNFLEISRFVIDPEYRNTPQIVSILIYSAFCMAQIYQKCKVVAMMEKKLSVLSKRVSKINMVPVSEVIEHRGERIIFASSLETAFKKFNDENKLLYKRVRNILRRQTKVIFSKTRVKRRLIRYRNDYTKRPLEKLKKKENELIEKKYI